jgi:hypothetical protein
MMTRMLILLRCCTKVLVPGCGLGSPARIQMA